MTYTLDPEQYWKLRTRLCMVEVCRLHLEEARRLSLEQWDKIGLDPAQVWMWDDEACSLTANE